MHIFRLLGLLALSLALASALLVAGEELSQALRDVHEKTATNEVAIDGDKSNDLINRFQKWFQQATSGAGKAVEQFVKSKQECFQMVQRYHKFYSTYEQLQKSRPDLGLAQANEFIAVEFSRVERELFAKSLPKAQLRLQLLNGAQPEVSLEQAGQSLETGDFLFEALKRLIDRLEELWVVIEREANYRASYLVIEDIQGVTLKHQVDTIKESSEFEESMERLRRIGTRMVRDMLAGELLQAPDSPLGMVAPLVQMLGMAHTSVGASYLTNVELRAVIGFLDNLNPVPQLVNGLFSNFNKKKTKIPISDLINNTTN